MPNLEEGLHFSLHGAVVVRLVGHDPASEIISRTLSHFKSRPEAPDLTLVLGEFPDGTWEPSGTLVGDRFLCDSSSMTTIVFANRVTAKPARSEVEYVLVGDIRSPGEPVTVYIPNLRKARGPAGVFRRDLRQGHLKRAALALLGNPFGMRQVVRQAEKITEEILEPFLFY